jgi:hypothetical protein
MRFVEIFPFPQKLKKMKRCKKVLTCPLLNNTKRKIIDFKFNKSRNEEIKEKESFQYFKLKDYEKSKSIIKDNDIETNINLIIKIIIYTIKGGEYEEAIDILDSILCILTPKMYTKIINEFIKSNENSKIIYFLYVYAIQSEKKLLERKVLVSIFCYLFDNKQTFKTNQILRSKELMDSNLEYSISIELQKRGHNKPLRMFVYKNLYNDFFEGEKLHELLVLIKEEYYFCDVLLCLYYDRRFIYTNKNYLKSIFPIAIQYVESPEYELLGKYLKYDPNLIGKGEVMKILNENSITKNDQVYKNFVH